SSIPTWQDIEKAIVNIVKAGVYYKKEKDGKFMQNYKKRYTELHQAEDPDIYILNNAKRIYPNEDKYISMKSQYQEWYKNEPKILQAVSKLSDLYYQLAKNHFATNEEIEEEADQVSTEAKSSIPTWQDIEKAIVNIVKAGVYYKKEKDGKFMQNYKKRYTELHQAEDPDIYILNNAKRIYPNEDKYISMKSQYQEWYKNEPKILQAVLKLSDLYHQLAKNHFATNEEIEEEAADVKIPSREKSSSSIFKISNVVPIGTAHLKREATSTTSGDILYNKKIETESHYFVITMAFHRPHPKRISHEPVSNRELELEQVNQALRDELSNEVSINKSNEKYINELEHKYTQCEKEIQSLNKELEWLDNALEEEKAELRSEIVSLKRSLYQAKKEIRDKVSYTDIIEKQLQESEERVQNLRLRFKIISSRRSSPILYNSEEDTDMAHIDPFINITRGLNRLENHFTGGTPLINPVNIIQGMYGTLNTIWANYQRIDQDLDDVTNQRDARDAQIVQLQQDVNHFRQQNIALQNHVNQLTLE
ncbi:15248_t:CDS:2, partial [Entrophospora sp. SA101]